MSKKDNQPKVKKEKKEKTKQQKWAIGLGIALAVLFVLTTAFKLAIMPNSPFYNNYALMIMPKSVDTTFDEKDLTLYIEKNKEFDKTKSQPLERFKVYYYEDNDTSKDKIYLENGSTLKGEKEESNLMVLQFLGSATITDGIIRKIANKIYIVLFILLAAYLIYIWYVIWSIRYDKKKELNNQQ
jgi:hypothetical protein